MPVQDACKLLAPDPDVGLGFYFPIPGGSSRIQAYTIRWDPIVNYPGSMVGGVGST